MSVRVSQIKLQIGRVVVRWCKFDATVINIFVALLQYQISCLYRTADVATFKECYQLSYALFVL